MEKDVKKIRQDKAIIFKIKKFIFGSRIRTGIALIILIILGFFGWQTFGAKKSQPQYQTAQAEKGTLVVSIAASGQVSAANNTSVSTQASGVVNKVYVQNGQVVKVGDKIAELDLDLDGKQRATQVLASYQNAQNSLESAKANLYSLQSTMFTNWKTYMDMAQSATYQNADGSPKTDQRQLPQYMSTDDDWLAAEAKYKNQQNVVNQAQTALSSAWLTYQQTSPVIYAPISGTVTGLSLQEGTVLLAQSNSSGTATSQKIASIKTNAPAQIIVNLTEIDVTKVKIGNKATITLDALSGKTYTGKVISIDTIGAISSGVTNYPAVIGLDNEVQEILPNMSVQASIITNVKNNVILVPHGAIQTQNEQASIRVLKNDQITSVPVEIGESSDTQTEVTSGLSEGETVVTGFVSSGQTSTTGASPFSSGIRFGGGSFGGGTRSGGGR